MDYEKLHKDTINKLQQMVSCGKITVEVARGICADFVPESEDERIRKRLLEIFESHYSNEWYGLDANKVIAWLEKQGEQEPVDKVEPKFHEGEWVQIDRGHVIKILEVEEEIPCYKILNYYGGKGIRKISDIDSIAHLWTIQDAKDGDVLTWDNGRYIILFKEIKDNIVAHCSYNTHSKHFGFSSNYDTQFDCIFNFTPATKEQRDLLFQKMKEAGYEWDAEKKELKKIEQKKEDASELTEFEAELFSMMSDAWQGYLRGEEVNIAEIVKEHSSELLERANEQKPAWNEGDEKMLSNIINCIKNLPIFYESINIDGEDKTTERFICDAINWLKSIKDRVQPQPKQEWSEEDEESLLDLIKFIENWKVKGKDSTAKLALWTSDEQKCDRLLTFLKSLRPQNR